MGNSDERAAYQPRLIDNSVLSDKRQAYVTSLSEVWPGLRIDLLERLGSIYPQPGRLPRFADLQKNDPLRQIVEEWAYDNDILDDWLKDEVIGLAAFGGYGGSTVRSLDPFRVEITGSWCFNEPWRAFKRRKHNELGDALEKHLRAAKAFFPHWISDQELWQRARWTAKFHSGKFTYQQIADAEPKLQEKASKTRRSYVCQNVLGFATSIGLTLPSGR